MDTRKFNRGLLLTGTKITDRFFEQLMEKVRTEVIPYQWEALNDRVEGAAPSFCMHNFRVAAKLVKRQHNHEEGTPPIYPVDQFNVLPEIPDKLEERFYGFVFQDSDLYKWIEASAYSLAQKKDPALEELVDQAAECICEAQYEDGYLDNFYVINNPEKRFTNLRDHHELYCLGHLAEGAVAYYEATGKDRLLKAAMRYADCVDRLFGSEEGKCKGYPGHEIAEMALVRLYEATGEERYLKLAKFFIDERGRKPYYFSLERNETDGAEEKYEYHQAHKPVREQDEAVGHAVRAVYLYTGMAEVAKYTKDEELYAACERLFQNIMQKKLYINGGIGATPEGEAFSYNYNLPNDKMYNETCASIGLVFFARRMLELSPKSYYADVMERALYNGVISGMALDGKSFFYVNPLEVEPEGCKKDAQRRQVALPRQKWFGCACCPPNLARLISSIFSYAYGCNETTLFCHLYLGGHFDQTLNGTPVGFDVESAYPWNDAVKLRLSLEHEAEFSVAIRLPGWCPDPVLKLNGLPADARIEDGYAYLTREWKNNDELTLVLPMEPVFYQADTHVRADIGKTALMRGPVVYCLEEADNGPDLHLLEADVHAPVQVIYENAELGDIVRLDAKGRRIQPDSCDTLYHPWTGYQYEEIDLHYIPYYTWCNRGVGEMTVYTRWYEK